MGTLVMLVSKYFGSFWWGNEHFECFWFENQYFRDFLNSKILFGAGDSHEFIWRIDWSTKGSTFSEEIIENLRTDPEEGIHERRDFEQKSSQTSAVRSSSWLLALTKFERGLTFNS